MIPDFRPPDRLRLGVAPLYTTYAEVFDAVERIAGVVERGEHEAMARGDPRASPDGGARDQSQRHERSTSSRRGRARRNADLAAVSVTT